MSVTIEQASAFLKTHGDFKVYGEPNNDMVYHGVGALNELGYWHWIKCFDPNRGFVLSSNNHVHKISNALRGDDHTGVTFGILMRYLQKMSKEFVEGDGVNEECTICESDCYHGNKTTLDCGHMFHEECIRKWHEVGVRSGVVNKCPNCRKDVIPEYQEMP
jgi:hypothetical protein